MFRVTSAEQTLTAILSVMAIVGALLRVQKKWDTTNAILSSLVTQVTGLERRNDSEHARMDARHDALEGRLNEHIGRHRRP